MSKQFINSTMEYNLKLSDASAEGLPCLPIFVEYKALVRSFAITHARFYFSHYSFQLTENYANYHIYTLSLIHALYACCQ